MVLEQDVVPSPELLSFFAQCLPVLSADDSLIGVTAWNENGKSSTLFIYFIVLILCMNLECKTGLHEQLVWGSSTGVLSGGSNP